MRLALKMERRTSPRKQPARASSDDDISETEDKTDKTLGKKKALHTMKKAKTTTKTLVRADSDDDYSSK